MASRLLVRAIPLALIFGFSIAASAQIPGDFGPREFPDDPFVPASAGAAASGGTAQVWVQGPHRSIQVNVTAMGQNILGDAANEPSIAIDPTNPLRMVIGWRQFDTITSNFRQAGVAYSHDGGQTWTKDTLDPGEFQSDPVLGADNAGNFYYSSLWSEHGAELFKSIDGGVTWLPAVSAFGGDKEWIAIDRTGGIDDGNIYMNWNVQFTCCTNTDFTRSIDGGASFQTPLAIPIPKMKWGTSDVGPDGELYLVGSNTAQTGHVVAKSSNAQDSSVTPSFDFVSSINLGGVSSGFSAASPNPGGLLGQVWIATDHSDGPTRGNVYMLASVDPPGTDPLDVMFIRSTNGGVNWTTPIRVNDDPQVAGSYQWFGTISVAPNGRIDAVWNDTRTDPTTTLRYSSSTDAGNTWAPGIAISPSFSRSLGYPNQNKLGDYYHMISDDGGANLAYAATFNGEQDVYFLRILVDCDGNGIDEFTTLKDYAVFQNNLTGPGPVDLTMCQTLLDVDGDSDIDLADFAELQIEFTGP